MVNSLFTNLTVVQLKRALAIKQRIAQLEGELSSVLGDSRPFQTNSGGVRGRRKRRKMSAAARAKIAAAARARWAKVRAAKGK